MRKWMRWSIVSVAVLVALTSPASAEPAELRTQMEQLKTVVEQQADTIRELQKAQSTKDFGRVHKEEMKKLMEEILDDAKLQPAMPKWMKNLKFYGDLRLRYQHDSRGWRRGAWPSTVRKDRNRARFRLRFGFAKTWWDKQMKVGFRLASGSGNDSDSTNQSFDTSFSKKPIWIDLAYAKYKPKWAKGLTVVAGKMKNPIPTKTLMTWDSDINPEGFSMAYHMPFFGDFKPYAQVGYWILEESNRNPTDPQGDTCRDATMWNYSLGFNWKIAKDLKWFFGTTFYDYNHFDVVGVNGGAGVDGQWLNHAGIGNAEMKILEMTTKVKWKMFDLPFAAWFSWAHNCADNYPNQTKNPAADRQFEDKNNAFGVGIKVGKNKKKGDWSFGYTYLYEEINSLPTLPGGFGLGDSDFGGPNRKGHIVGGKYNFDNFLTLGGKILISDPIHAAWPDQQDHTVTVQVDMIWKF